MKTHVPPNPRQAKNWHQKSAHAITVLLGPPLWNCTLQKNPRIPGWLAESPSNQTHLFIWHKVPKTWVGIAELSMCELLCQEQWNVVNSRTWSTMVILENGPYERLIERVRFSYKKVLREFLVPPTLKMAERPGVDYKVLNKHYSTKCNYHYDKSAAGST